MSEQTVIERNHTHTIIASPDRDTQFVQRVLMTSLPADPEVGGTTVHVDGKITWRGADLDSGKIAYIIPAVEGCQLKNSSIQRR